MASFSLILLMINSDNVVSLIIASEYPDEHQYHAAGHQAVKNNRLPVEEFREKGNSQKNKDQYIQAIRCC